MAQQWPGTLAEDHDAAQAAPAAPQRAVTIYSVRLPSGATFEVRGPSNATPQQLQQLAMADPGIANTNTDITGAEFQPKAAYDGQALAEYQPHGRVAGRDEKLAPDEQVVFGDEQAPKTAPRFTPEQEQQIMARTVAGDVAGALALGEQFGIQLNPESVQKTADFYQLPENRDKAPPSIGYGPTDKSAEQAMKTERYRQFADKPIDELRKNDVLSEGWDAFARGGAMGLDDEIDGIVSSVLHGGSVDDHVARARAIQDYDEQNNFGQRLAGGLVASMVLPSRIGAVGRPAAMAAYRDALAAGLGRAEARAVATQATRRAIMGQGTREGALYGAGTGAANADGDATDRLAGATVGAVEGSVAGNLAARAGTLGIRPPNAARTQAAEVGAAAERQGIDMLPADVSGPLVRRLTGGLAQSSVGGPQILNAAQRTVEQSQTALNRVRDNVGQALNLEASGQRASQGAKNFIDRTSTRARRLYNAAEGLAGNARVVPTQALAALDRNIAELAEVPGGAAGLERLRGLRVALANGDFSVPGIRGMRTALRDDFAENGLRGSDIERRVNQVIDGAEQDIETGLANRPGALRAYRVANRYWRARVRDIDEVITPIIGKDGQKSGKQVIGALQSAMNGNSPRLFRFLNTLDREERGNVTATLINQLGRATRGAQNAEGDAFSLSTFLSNWKDVGDSLGEAGKARLFTPEGRAALNDLALVAQGSRQAQGFANRSNTGSANWAIFNYVTTLPTIGTNLAGQYSMGRLLASPRFARWLARAPRTQLSAPAYIDRLTRIAKAEPALAGDALGLQRQLAQAFGGGMEARLAAEQPVNEAPRIQAQQDNSQDYPGEELPQ